MKKALLLLILLYGISAIQADDNTLPYWALGGFTRPAGINPLISPIATTSFDCPMAGASVFWECADTFNPAAVEKDGAISILYRAEDNPNAGIGGRTSRIGLARSKDGLHIDCRSSTPVMYPGKTDISRKYEWTGGCEDPRIVEAEIGGKTLYVMMYTSWNRSVARLSVASSSDLENWTHHGPIFIGSAGGKFANLFCKSGSIVTSLQDGRLKACKVPYGGRMRYFMYWGEYGVYGATSDDLISWEPILDSNNELVRIMDTRPGHFDSQMTECGPPAVLTENGIVLIYNSKNRASDGDSHYPADAYSAGQVLFSASDPTKILDRLDRPFFRPMDDFEKSGQYVAGTVFCEGLVYHLGKWFLYYGCADSKVAVAVWDPAAGNHTGDPVTAE